MSGTALLVLCQPRSQRANKFYHTQEDTLNIREFKAWLEGFEEAIDGAPTEAQWQKLKEKLNQVTESAHDLQSKFDYFRKLQDKKDQDHPFRKYDPIYAPGLPAHMFAPYVHPIQATCGNNVNYLRKVGCGDGDTYVS